MNWTGVIFLFLIFAKARSELYPEGYEWTYSYHVLLRSGTILPAESHSQWDLDAKLTITTIKNTTIVQLSNFNTSIFNGLRDTIPQDLNPSSIPKDANALETPFLIHYIGTQVDGISVSAGDPLWAVNMKRAIASILQINENKLTTPASFISESGLNGNCQGIEYSVVNNTEYVYVRKVIDQSQCAVGPVKWSSATPFLCPGSQEDTYSSSTTREYTLKYTTDGLELKHVMSSRRLYVQPFHAAAEAQQIYQYQVYQLLSKSPSKDEVKLPNDFVKKSLTFEYDIKDLTQGRGLPNQNSVLEQIHFLLDNLVTALDVQSLNRDTRELHNQILTKLYYNSFLLDFNSLTRLYTDISIGTSYQLETKRNIFLELLPQIGTTDSVQFMKELIVSRKLKDLTSIKLLSVFPFYVRHYSTKLLSDMEVLLNLNDNFDKTIRRTAILSFATLIYQSFVAGQCSPETLEDYGRKYFNLFSESTNYEDRMLYLQGLDNLQMGSVFNYMTSIIQNNEQSRHIRFLAVWASMPLAPFKATEVYELYWPILIDRAQHLEMRVAAFTMLFIAQPTKSRLLTLFWYMQNEPDPHLYNFFYTTLISLQKTTYHCYKHLGRLANHVVRFIRKPQSMQQWMTGNYLLDYYNSEGSFGGMMQLFLVGNPKTGSPNVVYVTFNNYATGKNLNQVAVYLKLQGVPDYIKNMIYKESFDEKKLEVLIKLLENSNVKLIAPEEVHLELIVKVQRKSVFVHYFNSTNFQQIGAVVLHLKMFLEYHLNYQSIFLPYLSEHMEPSDAGTLVLRGIVSNSVASMRGNSTSHHGNKINTYNFDLDFRVYTYTTNFLEVFNPVGNLWHGVHKSRSLQGRFLFNGTLLIDMKKSQIRLSEERGGTEYISMVLHAQSMTYIIGNMKTTRMLQQHCSHCLQQFVVNGDKNKIDETLLDVPFEVFGTKLEVKLYDCEKYQNHRRVFANVFSSHTSNAEILPLADPILYLFHLSDYVTYILPHKRCGISIYLKPFYDYPTELALALSLQSFTVLLPLNDQEPDSESNRVLTLTHRKLPDGPDLQFWNASMWIHSTPDLRNNSMNLTIEHVDAAGGTQMLCTEMNLILPVKQVGMLSVKPPDETFVTLRSVWGATENKTDSCPENGATLDFAMTAAISDEQKLLAEQANIWPYKQCRESATGKKYTPFSMPCYLAAREVAIYRKYTTDTRFQNMPEWFIRMAQKIQSAFGLLQKKPFANDALVPHSTVETHVKSSFMFSATVPKVTIQLNEKEASVDLPSIRFLDNLRFFLKNDWSTNLGYNKICVVSPKSVSTIDNRTIDLEEIKLKKKEILMAADCSNSPKFGIFLDTAPNPDEIAFKMFAGSDIVTVRPSQTVLVTINDVPFSREEDNQNLSIWRLPDEVVLFRTKYTEPIVSVHYTREYMVIDIQGLFAGKICGICSPHKTNLSNK